MIEYGSSEYKALIDCWAEVIHTCEACAEQDEADYWFEHGTSYLSALAHCSSTLVSEDLCEYLAA